MKLHLVLFLCCVGCGGSVRGAVAGSPRDFPGYPTQAHRGALWAEATYYTNHDDIFGTDLTRWGILPVALRVGIRGEDDAARRLADEFDPHLYLQDGTPLVWLNAELTEWKNKEVSDRVAEVALTPSLLGAWDASRPRFLFFHFDPEVRLDGTKALSQHAGLFNELDLLQSLLVFTVSSDSGPETLYVGLAAGRWTGR